MKKTTIGPQVMLYPTPTVLVGALVGDKPNLMTVAACGIASGKPPALSIAINKTRYTLKGIEEHGTFSVNTPSSKLLKEVDFCGIYSGKKRDKSKIFQVFYGALKTAPLIRECPLNIECKVIHSLDLSSHSLIVGEIVETHIDDECIIDGEVDPEKIDPITYILGPAQYRLLGEVIGTAFHVGQDKKSP